YNIQQKTKKKINPFIALKELFNLYKILGIIQYKRTFRNDYLLIFLATIETILRLKSSAGVYWQSCPLKKNQKF
ncbi:MAG: hypothetical protein P8Y08_14010, partial [Desulfobulbaceae bacterium]